MGEPSSLLPASYSQSFHESTFEYLKPTDAQIEKMARVRAAAKAFSDVLEAEVPNGADKNHVIHQLRDTVMWANVTITRDVWGTPRED